MGNKAREINSPVIKQLIDETNPEELAKIDAEMTNNKQQTAVEWFAMKLAEKLGMPNAISFYVDNQKEILQAKEMEKEQRSIEVPSDEEIYYAETQMPMNTFELGAKWMRDKIKGGEQ
jgi:hypothetical protein